MGNDCQLTKLLIFLTKTKLLGTTLGNMQRTEWRICILMVGCKGCNPLTPKSDQLLISPFLITPKSPLSSWDWKKWPPTLLVSASGNVWRTIWRICILMLGCEGFKSVECFFCGSIFLLLQSGFFFIIRCTCTCLGLSKNQCRRNKRDNLCKGWKLIVANCERSFNFWIICNMKHSKT